MQRALCLAAALKPAVSIIPCPLHPIGAQDYLIAALIEEIFGRHRVFTFDDLETWMATRCAGGWSDRGGTMCRPRGMYAFTRLGNPGAQHRLETSSSDASTRWPSYRQNDPRWKSFVNRAGFSESQAELSLRCRDGRGKEWFCYGTFPACSAQDAQARSNEGTDRVDPLGSGSTVGGKP